MRETPVTVVGTLVSDVRPRRVGAEGTLVLSFRIASNERRFDKVSETWVNGESLYLPVNCWRSLAENAASLVKGDPVIVSGKLRTREWTTEDGERHSVVELEASAIGPDLARCMVTIRKPRREEEPVSTRDPASPRDPAGAGDQPVEAPDGASQVDLINQTDAAMRTNRVDRTDEVTLSDLVEAARPLAPALA